MIVYISIGNSDDKLTQREWSDFVHAVAEAIENTNMGTGPGEPWGRVHGRWLSPADAPWQNACWCVDLNDDTVNSSGAMLRYRLQEAARRFAQDSIAWAEAPKTEFLGSTR